MLFKRISIALLLGLLFASSVFPQSALRRANKQYELSEYQAAAQSFQEVLRQAPDHFEGNYRLADCYRMMNQFDKALPHYQASISQGNIPDLYIFQYGMTLQGLGRYQLAQQVFEQLAVSSPAFRTRALQFAESCKFANSQTDPPRFTVKHEYLNTSGADFAPALFKDGRVVYASSRADITGRNSRNTPGSKDIGSNRLFTTQRDRNGYLETPTTLHAGLGAVSNYGPVSYSQDGRWVAVTKNNFTAGVRQIPASGLLLNLYLGRAAAEGSWGDLKPFQHNGAGYSNGYPSFSPDGRALYFASDRPGGFGGFDIYVSYRLGDSWSAPENLGAPVNSMGNEISPFFDGMALYFSSDYHQGFGGMDIFRAEESGGRWATIFHGSTGLNSSSDDYGFVFDPLRNVGYFTSNRPGGKGNEDIYKAEKETDNVVVKVTDAATGAALAEAEIDFTACGDQSYLTNKNGVFNFQLLDDLNCTAVVHKQGFVSQPIKITSLGLRQNRNLNVALTSMENAYQGKAVNAGTNRYLEDVKIIATPQGTKGEVVETYSDQQGGYLIALRPNRNYLLRYSKPGFQDVTFNFRTAADDSKLIRNIDLLPVGMTAAAAPASSETFVTIGGTSGPATTSQPGGFAVQVAAVAGDKQLDLSSYQSKLKGMGEVYSVVEDGKTKIRLGLFAERSEAAASQQKCRDRGYKGAFVVAEKSQPALAATAPPPIQQTSGALPSSQPTSELNGYMVRLAVFSNLDFFDRGAVDDVGVIYFVPKSNMTIVLLGGYDTMESALIGLRKAKVRGFPDAYLVRADRGLLEKVR